MGRQDVNLQPLSLIHTGEEEDIAFDVDTELVNIYSDSEGVVRTSAQRKAEVWKKTFPKGDVPIANSGSCQLLDKAEESKGKSTKIKGDLSGNIKRAIQFAKAIQDLAARIMDSRLQEVMTQDKLLEAEDIVLKEKLREVAKKAGTFQERPS